MKSRLFFSFSPWTARLFLAAAAVFLLQSAAFATPNGSLSPIRLAPGENKLGSSVSAQRVTFPRWSRGPFTRTLISLSDPKTKKDLDLGYNKSISRGPGGVLVVTGAKPGFFARHVLSERQMSFLVDPNTGKIRGGTYLKIANGL
jgi:hypothetical protein